MQDSVCHGSSVESYGVQYLLEASPEKLTTLSTGVALCSLRSLSPATRYQAKVKVREKVLSGSGWREPKIDLLMHEFKLYVVYSKSINFFVILVHSRFQIN